MEEIKQKFWRGVFSDDGQPSFSRVATAFLLCFACGWVTAIVWKKYELPDFAGIVMFVGVLYGINTLPKVTTPFSNKPKDGGQ